MKTGIMSDAYTAPYGLERGYCKMKEHGYDHADYQGLINVDAELYDLPEEPFRETLEREAEAARAAGVTIFQMHGPWGGSQTDLTKQLRRKKLEQVRKAIRGTAYLGCENFVIHNVMPFGDADGDNKAAVYEINAEFFSKAAEYAASFDVTVCLENMPFGGQYLARPADMLAFVKSLDYDNFRMCLDTGHCSVFGISPAESARLLGKEYLKVLHVHDNNGVSDFHWVPYTGVIDWDDFTKALREIGYEGPLSLETCVPRNMPLGAEREKKELELAAIAKKIAGE
jgi:sugar phosphate isomerase/epimerase